MKSLNFAIEFKTTSIIKIANDEIDQVNIGDSTLGYISIKGDIVTPFTAAGELPETHCKGCAAEALFSSLTGIPVDSVNIAEAVNSHRRSPVEGLIMSALLAAASRSAH